MKSIVKTHVDKIIIEEFNEKEMRFYESIMSLSNGYMGIRGGFEEGCRLPGLRGTYMAGVWYPDKTKVGWWKNGYPEFFGKAVNAANIIDIDIYTDGCRVEVSNDNLASFYCELDMEKSILKREVSLDTTCGLINVKTTRFLSFDIKHWYAGANGA